MRIPTYIKQIVPSAKTDKPLSLPGERRKPDPVADVSAVWDAVSKVADVAIDIDKKMYEAERVEQTNVALQSLFSAQEELMYDAKTNPESKKLSPDEMVDVYSEKQTKVYNGIAKNITNKKAQTDFTNKYKLIEIDTKAKLKQMGWNNQVVRLERQYAEDLINSSKYFVETSNPNYLQMGKERIAQQAVLFGWDDATIAAEERKFYNNTVVDYYEKYINDSIMNGPAPELAYDFIMSEPEAWKGLESDNQIKVQRAARIAWNQRKTVDKRTTAGDIALVNRHWKDSIASISQTGKPMVGVDREILRVKGEAALNEYKRQEAHAYKVNEAGLEVVNTTWDDIPKLIEKYKPKAGEEGYADKDHLYNTVVKGIQAKYKALVDDPVDYIRRNVKLPLQKVGEEDTPEVKQIVLHNNSERLVIEQRRQGIFEDDVRLLTNDQAKAMVVGLEKLEGEDASKYIEQLQQQYGSKYYPTIYKDLVRQKLHPGYQDLASIPDPHVRHSFGEALKLKEKDIKESMGSKYSENMKKIREDVDEELEEYMVSIMTSGETIGNMRTYGYKRDNAVKMAAFYVVTKGMDPDDAAEKATKELTNGRYNFVDNYRVPIQHDHRVIEKTADNILNNMDTVELIENQNSEIVKKSIRQNGYWATNQYETGIILFHESGIPVLMKNGTIVELLFQGIMEDPNYEKPSGFWEKWLEDYSEEDYEVLEEPKQVPTKKVGGKIIVKPKEPIPTKKTDEKITVKQVATAIKHVESRGNYKAKSKDAGYGAYQIMPATWKAWAKEYTNSDKPLPMTPENQDMIAEWKIQQWIDEGLTVEEIAAKWNSGSHKNWKKKIGVNKWGVKYNVPAYVKKVNKALKSLSEED